MNTNHHIQVRSDKHIARTVADREPSKISMTTYLDTTPPPPPPLPSPATIFTIQLQ